jgi:hypothetical protein
MSKDELKINYPNNDNFIKYSYRAFDNRFLLDENSEIAR